MITQHDVITAFCDKLAEYGVAVSDTSRIKFDGNWHRLHVSGDRGTDRNLSYKIHFDDRPAGFFQDHKRGFSGTFTCANGEDLDPAARAAAQAAWKRAQIAREREQALAYEEAAATATATLNAAQPATADHPYLARKGIAPTPGLKQDHATGNLLLPVYSDFGVVASYQTISTDGEKLFMTGGKMAGSFHPINGAKKEKVLVCEGYATGAALHAVTGYSVACAMSAGNLPAIVKKMQAKFPDREIVAAVDNDHGTADKTGRNPGVEAGERSGVRFIAPQFPAGTNPKHTDWDDWLRGYGTAAELLALIAETTTPDESGAGVAIGGGTESAGGTDHGEAIVGADPNSGDALDAIPPIPLAGPLSRLSAELDTAADPDADGLPEMYSEDNVGLRFSQLFADELRYVAPWGRWMRWDNQRWANEDTLQVFDYARKVCRSVAAYVRTDPELTPKQKQTISTRYGTAQTIASIERLARADRRHAATISQWDADPWALNTPAGVVDLRTGSLTAGSRLSYMTKITRASPGGACPNWLRFLQVATAGDTELVGFLKRMAGYTLTGSTRDHALFFVYGTGGNGKGTFLNTLQWLIGDYAKAAAMDVFTEKKHDSHPTELAGLMGARMVTAQETEEGKRWAEARIKALTGGDPITARFMRQDNFEFIPQFKLVIAGNHKPGLRNVDEAIKRRLHLIPFTVTIAPELRDVHLSEKLQAEAGGILQWMIEGCLEWQRDGLKPPASVIAATEEYLEQEDQFVNWMADCCELGTGFSYAAKPLYASYKQWAERAGEFAIPQKRWSQQMNSRGFESSRSKSGVMYRGLRVNHENFNRPDEFN